MNNFFKRYTIRNNKHQKNPNSQTSKNKINKILQTDRETSKLEISTKIKFFFKF